MISPPTPIGLGIWQLNPQLVVLCGEAYKVTALLEEAYHWEQGSRFYTLALLPISFLLVSEDVSCFLL